MKCAGVSRRQYYSGERACLLVILHQYLTNFALIFHIGLFIYAYMGRKMTFAGALRITGERADTTAGAVRVEELYSKSLTSCNPVIKRGSLPCALFP